MMALVLTLALAPSQLSPQLRPQQVTMDPFLWPEITEAVGAAAEAELDPKRGAGNAAQILEAERTRHGSDRLRTALRLRRAATELRAHFRSQATYSSVDREVQALSTFSRLDLAEPGLGPALQRVLEAKKAAEEEEDLVAVDPSAAPDMKLRAAILSRSSSLDKKAFTKSLRRHLRAVGVTLVVTPPKKAEFLLKAGTKGVESSGGARRVSVRLDLEHVLDGRTIWRHALFRTSEADTAAAAAADGIEWLSRIGGRDILFRFLSESAIPELRPLAPVGRPVHGRGHGPVRGRGL